MSVTEGKWTCPRPDCGHTVTVVGTQADTRAAIAACQRRHADGHRRGRLVLARIDDNERER